MREFTPEEQLFMKDLSSIKKVGNLQELQIFHLLRPKLKSIALKWALKPLQNIKIYYPTAFIGSLTNEIMKAYYDIVDFIYFIEELEKCNLIRVQNISFSNRRMTISHCLYDNVTYEYDGSEDIFKYSDGGTVGLVYIRNKEVNNDFVVELEKYINAYIFPLPALDDLIANDFKDFDQRVFEENRNSNKQALNYSRRAILQTNKSLKQTSCTIKISIGALFLSALSVFVSIFFDDNPKRVDMQNIKNAILQKKTITIDSIAKYNADTINVNITNKPQLQPIDVKATIVPNKKKN